MNFNSEMNLDNVRLAYIVQYDWSLVNEFDDTFIGPFLTIHMGVAIKHLNAWFCVFNGYQFA